ncbi:MAG: AAA family ATPase [Nostoc sp. ChiSLP01]|nr:AAA family ATPase [Nostoc sp. CmiSLP01]MDZ8286048.1 AAA family ATPase [Nostoc sp. ChiSLP01]
MKHQFKPIQKILFGSPGTGKSYEIRKIVKELGISNIDPLPNTVKTVFHPEYTYSDFMGKLLPLSNGTSIVYKYYVGHFLQVLGMAYYGLIDDNNQNYVLVIDELNRGNASAIFGLIFQLLDRENNGWSTYEVDISEMELVGLLNAMGYRAEVSNHGQIRVNDSSLERFFLDVENEKKLSPFGNDNGYYLIEYLRKSKIKIPPNLSIIATINTSDESIYYLDSAFKRRWSWEYVDAPSTSHITNSQIPPEILNITLSLSNGNTLNWYRCIVGVNEFIKLHHQSIRRIEDKQIGWWFIKPTCEQITLEPIKDKLMFYLWDSVFAKNKDLLAKFIKEKLNKENVNLATYADFLSYTVDLLEYWHESVTSVKEDIYEVF